MTLKTAFNDLRKQSPKLFGDSEIYSYSGTYGFVADHGDGTVSKILYRKSPALQAVSENELRKEIANLQLLDQVDCDGFSIPRLVSGISPIEGFDEFYASYRMTKIEGQPANWVNVSKSLTDDVLKRHFENAGEVLGQFHSRLSALKADWIFSHPAERGGVVLQVPELEASTNRALSLADAYLKANAVAGVIHGDFHGRNLVVDSDHKVTGIVDFSQTGPCVNRLTDFSNIPDRFTGNFTKGYETATGIRVDADMIAATQLNMYSGQAKYHGGDNAAFLEARARIGTYLQGFSRIPTVT